MMETLQVVASKLKIGISKKVEADLIEKDYGIKSCKKSIFKDFNYNKLELIFLSNLCYITIRENQMKQILAKNYKDLFKKKTCKIHFDDIELKQPVIVINNNTITNNNTVNNNFEEDIWDQTDW